MRADRADLRHRRRDRRRQRDPAGGADPPAARRTARAAGRLGVGRRIVSLSAVGRRIAGGLRPARVVTTSFGVWAPRAERVDLVLGKDDRFPMARAARAGWWELESP